MIAYLWRYTVKERVILVGLILACLALVGRMDGAHATVRKETTMTARGTFDVKVAPQPQDDPGGGPFGRLFLDKEFRGDLQGTSKGQMLATGTGAEQSGGYVALELVSGTLHGKRGSFILQHKGTMRKGTFAIDVTVVPDSGTDQLAGISGTMTILIEGRKHSYEFKYTLEKQ
jgi:hypothetical protein